MRLKFLTNWYLRFERLISSLSLVGGFIFDIFALKRIDLFWENLWVGAHLGVAALGILFINLYENRKNRLSERASRIIHFWLIIVIQFAFGGLLSTFLVFYFRSGSLASSWPFMLVLAVAFVFNELLKHHYSRLVFQTSVLFLSIYSFAIFIVPVIFHKIGPGVFILSGLFSLILLTMFVLCLWHISRERFRESGKLLLIVIVGITVLINALYFTNLIPPIPLSLKDAGVYHTISRNAAGNYTVTGEQQGFWDYFRSYELFHEVPGRIIYAYSSIFSPTNLNTQIVHEWQHYNETVKKWVTEGRVNLSIVGGRDGGFRTYSSINSSQGIVPVGLWRVNVETPQGQLLGRIKFEVENVDKSVDLITNIL